MRKPLMLATCASLLVLSGIGWAQPSQPIAKPIPFESLGSRDSSLARDQVVAHSAGFSTTVPANFQVKHQGSGAIAIQPDQGYLLTIKGHSYPNFEAFAADAMPDKDGYLLIGEVQDLSETDRCFRAVKGNQIADVFIRFSPTGGGCMIVALSDETTCFDAFYSAYRMSERVEFAAPEMNAQRLLWQSHLSGQHLVYQVSAGSHSERRDLYLWSSGRFASRRSDPLGRGSAGGAAIGGALNFVLAFGSGGKAPGDGISDGKWQIVGNSQLVLVWENGQIDSFDLAEGESDNELLLSGKRYQLMVSE